MSDPLRQRLVGEVQTHDVVAGVGQFAHSVDNSQNE